MHGIVRSIDFYASKPIICSVYNVLIYLLYIVMIYIFNYKLCIVMNILNENERLLPGWWRISRAGCTGSRNKFEDYSPQSPGCLMDSGIVNCNLNLQMVHLGKEYVSRNGPAQNVPFYHDFETQNQRLSVQWCWFKSLWMKTFSGVHWKYRK